jgi:hypothetical protein
MHQTIWQNLRRFIFTSFEKVRAFNKQLDRISDRVLQHLRWHLRRVLFGFRPEEDKAHKRRSYFAPIASDSELAFWPRLSNTELTEIKKIAMDRVASLSESVEKAEYSAETLLLTANAGAVITILGFMQKDQGLRDVFLVKAAFGIFLLAIIFLTGVKFMRIARGYYIRGEWTKNCSLFFSGQLSFDELLKRDSEAWRYPTLLMFCAWASYMCFLIGAIVAGFGIAYLPSSSGPMH